MSTFPYKNPISSEQLNGVQSVERSEVFGTNFSVLSVGGYMEVFNLSDLNYTINGLGPIEYSGNSIPIDFLKGTGAPWSPDVLTLNSDNISSGRRRLGMLVYVYEVDQVYQYRIDNYESLWTAATASPGTVVISDFGTTVYNSSVDGQNFINAWTASTIEDVSGYTHSTAVWKKYTIPTLNSSTGVFVFTGLSIASTTTFTVAPVKGWIVNDTTNPLSPQLYYVDYSGGTHTATYVTTATETWVYLTSGGTISQSNIELTEQQRRQNIFLGKLGHANKTNIINAFSQPDFVLSPLAQLRDMFAPIGLINQGIYASANGVNLSFNTSAGYLHGLGINFAINTLSPNELYVTGTSPCTFQYRTQTGGTASNTTFIDPTKWDVGGVVTSITGTKATNQRIYLVQNGVFRVQYGQTEYNQLSAAIEGIATEQFNTFINFTNNGILIGVLSVLSTATDLSDTSKARFFFTSKFGETVGAAGGVATTTLQQAYNNSSEPEITTNSILNALVIKNGTGNADNVSNLFEGQNTAGTVTSFIRADGAFSGTSMYVTGITATTISATTIYANGGNVVTKISSGIDSTGNTTTGSYQLVQSVLIPANTIKNGDVVLFKARYRKVGANAAANYRITVNTTLNLTGAQIVGQFNSGLTILYLELSRTAAVKGGTTEVFNTSVTNVQDDVTQSTIAVTNLTIDWTINQYVMYSILNSSASDTTFVSYYSITEI